MSMFYFCSSGCLSFSSINLFYFFGWGQSNKIITLHGSFSKFISWHISFFYWDTDLKTPYPASYRYIDINNTILPSTYNLNFPFTRFNRTTLELEQVFLTFLKERRNYISSLYIIKGIMNDFQRFSEMTRNTMATVCLIKMKTICCKCLLKMRGHMKDNCSIF